MAKQLLLNRGFESGLANFNTQGAVSTNIDIAHSGIKSAQLLATNCYMAELSQVVSPVIPGTMVRFSFRARRLHNEEVKNVSNVEAQVNFLSAAGTLIPPSMLINLRGSDLSKKRWNFYEEYGEIPQSAVAAQIVIRLKQPQSGTSGLLVDDLALLAEAPSPLSMATPAWPTNQPNPFQQVNPLFPGWPLPTTPPQPAQQQQQPASPCCCTRVKEIIIGPK